MSETAARLAEYRRKKQEAETQAKRKEAFWNALTFAPFRRRLAASLAVAPEEKESNVIEGGEGEQDLEEEKEVIWTKLDWVILAVKVLVYASLQVLFIKLEFGAVFFLASGVLFMWQSLENRKRRAGEKSAYSVFNPGCEAIHGTLKSEDLVAAAK